jgi:hypothetical protein
LPHIDDVSWDDRTLLRSDLCLQTDAGRAVRRFAPDLAVVDLHWLPATAVLAELRCPALLLVRDVPAVWLRGPTTAPFRPSAWEAIVAIEPWRHARVPGLVEIPAVVTANPEEFQPRTALAEHLGLDASAPIVLVAQTGQPGELAQMRERVNLPAAQVRELSMDATDALVPLGPWLASADRIIGGAGYNLFWETRWPSLARRAELVALPRNNDDQAWRIRACSEMRLGENGADRLVAYCTGGALTR